ncbi:MAG: DUF5686 family protein [Ignavibacteriota bacterium]|nr:DUF5686 family protein [Ignavibacteriota bacterium]
MKLKSLLLLLVLVACNYGFSQTYKITGKIVDAKTNRPLSFASMKVLETGTGTTADVNGEFILNVKDGSYNVVTSYIGYFSDTSSFYITGENTDRNVFLKSTDIYTEMIDVEGEDPAYEIIRKAIKYKQEFKKDLNEYNYDAYSKFVVKSNVNPYEDKSVKKDSNGMNILGILESESVGYFKKPDLEKQIIKSKRETANITRGFAIPLIVNFYDEKVDLGESKIPGPLCDDAFDSYEYKLIGTTSIDSTTVFKIKVINTSTLVPQFLGNIYIIDKLFALIKVDLEANSEVIKSVDKLAFRQKFSQEYDKDKKVFWMPTDVEIYASGTFAGLIKFRGDVFTIVSGYRLNEKAPADIWDEVVIKVEKDAKKDSTYWQKNQLMKNTSDENKAYKSIEKSMQDKPGIKLGVTSISFGKHVTADLLETYKFNSVAGNQLGLKLNYQKDFGRITSDFYAGYGFSDKKAKYKFNFATQLLNDRSLRINVSAVNFLQSPFMFRGLDADWLDVLYTLGTKKERYVYYNLNGYSIEVFKKIIPQIGIGIGYNQGKRTSAFVNTDYSFSKKPGTYGTNPLINDDFRRSLSLSFRIDPNKYRAIDWGDGDYSRFRITEYPWFTFKVENASKEFLQSTYDNRKYTLEVNGRNNFAARIKPTYKLGVKFMNGTITYQDINYFDVFKNPLDPMTFAAMDYNEFGGSQLYFFNVENNFGKLFPKNIPILKSLDFIGFFNAGQSTMNDELRLSMPNSSLKGTDGTMFEVGFAIANVFDVARMNFGWRLNNYKPGSNFIFYLSFF